MLTAVLSITLLGGLFGLGLGWAARRFHVKTDPVVDQIDAILMSPDHVLSFQVGNEVFSLPTRPGKKAHQAAIDELLRQVQPFTGVPATTTP